MAAPNTVVNDPAKALQSGTLTNAAGGFTYTPPAGVTRTLIRGLLLVNTSGATHWASCRKSGGAYVQFQRDVPSDGTPFGYDPQVVVNFGETLQVWADANSVIDAWLTGDEVYVT